MGLAKGFLDDRNIPSKNCLEDYKVKNNIPEGYEYIGYDGGIGILQVVEEGKTIKLVPNIDGNIPKEIGENPQDIFKYLHNAQKSIEITDVFLDDKKFEKEKLCISPYKETTFESLLLIPQPLDKTLNFEAKVSLGGKIYKTKFERIPYEKIGVMRLRGVLSNIIIVFIDRYENGKFQLKINFKLANIKKIEEILDIRDISLKKYKFKINRLSIEQKELDFGEIVEFLEFWYKVNEIGKKLNIKFEYTDELIENDINVCENLYNSLCKNKFTKNKIILEENSRMCIEIDKKNNVSETLNSKGCVLARNNERISFLNQTIEVNNILIFYNVKLERVEKILNIEPFDDYFIMRKSFLTVNRVEKEYKKLLRNSRKLTQISQKGRM